MSKPSNWRPTWKGFFKFMKPDWHGVWIGFLTAIGILRLKSHVGAYWAQKQSTKEWELRVPYRPGQKPF